MQSVTGFAQLKQNDHQMTVTTEPMRLVAVQPHGIPDLWHVRFEVGGLAL